MTQGVNEAENTRQLPGPVKLLADGHRVRTPIEPCRDDLRHIASGPCELHRCLDKHSIDVEVAFAEIAGAKSRYRPLSFMKCTEA